MSNSPLRQVASYFNDSKYLEAEKLLWELYSKSKKDPVILKTLGLALLLQAKHRGSLKVYKEAYELKKDDFDIVNNLSHLYLKFEEFQKSFNLATMAHELDPSKNQPFITLLELDLRKREFKSAVSRVDEITKRINFDSLIQNPNVLYSILDSYVATKNNEDLLKFINYVNSKVFNPEIFYYQSTTLPDEISEQALANANKILKYDGFKNPVERAKTISPILFGFAKYFENKKDIRKSDEYYDLANREVDKVQRFQPLINQKLVSRIKNNFTQKQINITYPQINDEGLIFIVGMPRSGTTLVESIIASAPNVISGGELVSFHDLVSSSFDDDPEIENVENPGAVYLNRISFIRGKKKFFIDKLPGNYHTLGYIHHIFPKAKIIYLKRDPWDTAISIYKQFYVSNIPYASTFFNIALTYANHEEIIRFWKDSCEINFLTVEYEKLVKNINEIAKNIYEFCEIDHDYNPDDRKGHFARTASKNQVNKDVHSSSIGKKSFENHKSDFLNNLENQRKYWSKNR